MPAMMFTPFEPKAKFRFVFYIDGIESYLIKQTDLPNLENENIVIDYINVNFKVKGRSNWNDINMTLYDPVDPTGAAMVHDWIDKTHKSDNGVDGFAFDDYKKQVSIKYVNPKGSEFQEWKIFGAFIKTSNWGEVDWSSTTDPITIQLTLSYDYARLI